tara:strand:+ start:3259 stop:3843 length:585 start_codon:yes stop_codon:yes gene_type:complete
MDKAWLPLFPLKSVLFPCGPLKLRIFEPRYLAMISSCLRENSGFGVLLITDGEEAGNSETVATGTIAKIVDWDQGRDCLLGITAEGQQKFRLNSSEKRADGLYIGKVQEISDEPNIPVPDKYAHLVNILKEVLDTLDVPIYKNILKKYDNAAWVGHRLSEIMPLNLANKQSSLAMDDPLERLKFLATMFAIKNK